MGRGVPLYTAPCGKLTLDYNGRAAGATTVTIARTAFNGRHWCMSTPPSLLGVLLARDQKTTATSRPARPTGEIDTLVRREPPDAGNGLPFIRTAARPTMMPSVLPATTSER